LKKNNFVIEIEVDKKGSNIISFLSKFHQKNWK